MMRARIALLLAIAATSTAVCMSVLAGWQRGGWLSERLVWLAIGIVLVTGAHLLPALSRSVSPSGYVVSSVLWLGCMGAASYGHTTFFLLSQSHAGEARAFSVSSVPVAAHRDLTRVMADRAAVTAQLAQANTRRCAQTCPSLQARRISLAAQLEALDAEAAEVRRDQAIEDGNVARQATVRADPVTARLAILFGVSEAQLDLFAGLAYAAVLEGMACLLWWIALTPRQGKPKVTNRHIAARTRTVDAPSMTVAQPAAVRIADPEVTRLLHDVEAGVVKPTVVGIRRHLRCSQAKAAVLRRQLADLAA